jgi:K+-sensing histidine kinase KdpD
MGVSQPPGRRENSPTTCRARRICTCRWTERAVVGVLSVKLPDKTLPLARRDLLEAYARQAALVLDRVALRAAAEQSKLVAESERLSNALLNSISHELRTPLAAITSAASALAESKGPTRFRPQNGRKSRRPRHA